MNEWMNKWSMNEWTTFQMNEWMNDVNIACNKHNMDDKWTFETTAIQFFWLPYLSISTPPPSPLYLPQHPRLVTCRRDWGCCYVDRVPHQAAATQQLQGIRWALVQCWASVAEHCVVFAQSISWQIKCRLPINTSITVKWVSVRLTSNHSDNIIIWQRRLI